MALPPAKIAARALLQHVSRCAYRGTSLYFGRDGTNRYDSPGRDYGVLYLGFELSTALMESVFHKHQWHRQSRRTISAAEVDARLVRVVGVLDDLVLADLTAAGVMTQHFGLNLSQLAGRRYVHTQRISETVHDLVDAAGTPALDGLLYPSRNNYPAKCVALFERAATKVSCIDDIDLADHVDWPRFVVDHKIGIVSAPVGAAARKHAETLPEPDRCRPPASTSSTATTP